MTAYAAPHDASPGGTDEPGQRRVEVFARRGRLCLDGAPVPFVYAFTTNRIADPHEPNTVRVVGVGMATSWDIAFATTEEAERLLSSMEVDARERVIEVAAGRLGITPLVVLFASLGVTLPAVFAAMWSDRPAAFWIAFAILAGGLALASKRSRRLRVDADGLTISGYVFPTRLRWSDVTNVERYGDAAVRLHLSDVLYRKTRTVSRDPMVLDHLGIELREGLYFLLLRRRAAANRAAERLTDGGEDIPASEELPASEPCRLAPLLARGERDDVAWVTALAELAPRTSYRQMAPADDDLVAVARDLDVDTSARVAAVALLRRRGQAPPPLHLTDASPALRDAVVRVTERLAVDPNSVAALADFAATKLD